ncbi:anaerobic ribonucleoside-triphosphate reductase activating protein [Aestuariibacter halophilus]|uniref:Anaerobic ribonucleoside-triphosphate reductase activating protein n=1 Tax=Fluctibacter halophilus TaxID=226011 RepID=A0ABS8G742_9ALTE|nr:anaerobic ribonucleoside-triphosphate reductase activating protein [Aestuariibacter halophilus]MCC2615046.1 anaerobic ribonucleoside-triphosphate reductase activating protein [Aestuariibacter halophilus]
MKPFNTSKPHVLFQEVPDEVSLAFTISGCPLGCFGCHSAHTWDPYFGVCLTDGLFLEYLSTYKQLISCVVFFGGEWHVDALLRKLQLARRQGLKTCLFTGLDSIPKVLQQQLTYLKTGRWLKEVGGLDSPTTNQRFIELSSGNLLNYKFQENTNHVAA